MCCRQSSERGTVQQTAGTKLEILFFECLCVSLPRRVVGRRWIEFVDHGGQVQQGNEATKLRRDCIGIGLHNQHIERLQGFHSQTTQHGNAGATALGKYFDGESSNNLLRCQQVGQESQ